MKLRIQTLTGQVGEVGVDPQNTILDLNVSSRIKYNYCNTWQHSMLFRRE